MSFDHLYRPIPSMPAPWDTPMQAPGFPFIPPLSPPTGWVCPRCQAVNGPHVDQCPCAYQVIITTTCMISH